MFCLNKFIFLSLNGCIAAGIVSPFFFYFDRCMDINFCTTFLAGLFWVYPSFCAEVAL